MHSGGQILVKTLYALGIRRVFCVAGESYLPALDAMLDYPDLQVVTCRHESGATFMAEAYANLTGKPGVAFVTRGPGACNGSIGLHAGVQASTPMLFFVGLIHSDDVGKEAFQEFDLPQMFGSLSKAARVIPAAADIQEHVECAYNEAMNDRPGPVVLGLPEDILVDKAPARATKAQDIAVHSPNDQDMQQLSDLLAGAQKPLVIVGGSLWTDEECAALAEVMEQKGLPVAASFRRQDLFDHNHEGYVGDLGFGPNPALVAYAKQADIVIALGARISDVMSQGYTLFGEAQKIVHIYPCDSVFGKAYAPALAIKSHMGPFIKAFAALELPGWAEWVSEGRENYARWTDIPEQQAGWDGADMTQVFRQLREVLPDDAIITSDAGNFYGWVSRYLRYVRPGRQIAPLAGSMGYCVPAAVSAAITEPERLALGICGDGCFMMTGQELATAMHHAAKPIIMVCNNNMYGTIRMHQEKDFPGRESATALTNPDFVKLAESYGALGLRITNADQFPKIWQQAQAADRAVLIEIVMDQRQVSSQSKL